MGRLTSLASDSIIDDRISSGNSSVIKHFEIPNPNTEEFPDCLYLLLLITGIVKEIHMINIRIKNP